MNIRRAVLLVVVVCVFGTAAFGQPWDGNGVEGDPYLIYDACDMQAIGADSNYWDSHFVLCEDINLGEYTGTSFNIIGYGPTAFTGVFDGNGLTVSNFTYDSNGVNNVGLFGFIRGAEVKGLVLVSPNVSGGNGNNVGGLVGYSYHSYGISGCYIEGGVVSGRDRVGGLVGHSSSSGSISNCYVEGGVVTGNNCVGGLVGYKVYSGISGCYSTGVVSGEGYVGGLIGRSGNMVANSYSMCSVTGNSYVGGLVGYNSAGIYYCYSTGSVLGTADVGGLVGYSASVAVGSYWDTETSGIDYSSTGTGLTTAQMQSLSTFAASGWGCDGVWTIDDGNDYPRLLWEGSGGELITGQLADFISGAGSEAEPFEIYTTEELNLIGLFMYEWDKHFKLMADIDTSGIVGRGFNIIGSYDDYPFTGVFDGNGHTISNFTYGSNGLNYIGLFGYIDDPNAEIKNLGLINPNINAGTGDMVGALVGTLWMATITNCYVEGGNVSGSSSVGGLVGRKFGEIAGCYSTGNISGNSYVGGLAGLNFDRISGCYSTGSVSGSNAGGLVGSHYGTITESYSESNVVGGNRVGGLVGSFSENGSIISDSYSTGSITGGYEVGGMVGLGHDSIISNCYSRGDVTGLESVGGLVGRIYRDEISNCYSTGSVSGGDYVGGLAGENSYGEVTNSYWDVNSSDCNSSAGGTGKTTVEMQTESTFTDAGWDFVGEVINGPNDIWDICDGTNYPKFVWQIPIADFICPDGVTLVDFSVLGLAWYSDPNQPNWNLICDISEPNDNFIDELDLKVFTENWLAGL